MTNNKTKGLGILITCTWKFQHLPAFSSCNSDTSPETPQASADNDSHQISLEPGNSGKI